jgi:hypothetical protein
MQVRAVRTLCARSLALEEIDATLAFMLAVEVARVAAGTAWLAETAAGRVIAGTAFVPQGEDVLAGLLARPLSRCRHTTARQHAFAGPASIRTSRAAASHG